MDFSLGMYGLALLFLGHGDRGFDQVADDLLHITTDIADLGKLGRLNLDKGRFGQFCQTAGDLGLAATGRADHQDVFRQHFLTQRAFQLLTAPAVAQRNRDGTFGVVLADDEAIKLGNNLAG